MCVRGDFRRVSFTTVHIVMGLVTRSRENPISIILSITRGKIDLRGLTC